MTTWSVVNDDTREKRWQDHFPRSLPRYALLVCLALVVVSLGVVLTPARPPEPAEPPFSEQARAAALAETVRLLDAGSQLGTAARTVQNAAGQRGRPSGRCRESRHRADCDLADTPGASAAGARRKPCGPGRRRPPPPAGQRPRQLLRRIDSVRFRPARSARRTSSGDRRRAGGGSGRQRPPAPRGRCRGRRRHGTAAGRRRHRSAAAGVRPRRRHRNGGAGSRRNLPAAVRHLPVAVRDGALHRGSGRSRTVHSSAARRRAIRGRVQPRRRPGGRLSRTEAQTIYGYQVALTRLGGDAAKSAAEELAHHDALLGGVESLSRLHLFRGAAARGGLRAGPSFLASPAAGLGDLEAAALPVYGDLVALSEGETRQWAIAALFGLRSGRCCGVRIPAPCRAWTGPRCRQRPAGRRPVAARRLNAGASLGLFW